MKISNTDLIALTEIKLYFLDPPQTYKLPVYAKEHLAKALEIFNKYPLIKKENADVLESLQQEINGGAINSQELKERLRETGKMIAGLTNK